MKFALFELQVIIDIMITPLFIVFDKQVTNLKESLFNGKIKMRELLNDIF